MPKRYHDISDKNIIKEQLIVLRKQHGLSQRDLAAKLQLCGYDIDKNMINRIETGKRCVTDVEIKIFAEFFHVSYDYLIDGPPHNEE